MSGIQTSPDLIEPVSTSKTNEPEATQFDHPAQMHQLKQQPSHIAILAAVVAFLSLCFPFMRVFSTRVMPIGEAVYVSQLDSLYIVGFVLAWLGILVSAFIRHSQIKKWALAVSVSMATTVFIMLSSFATVGLVESELSRISLSTGAWFLIFAIYIALFAVYQHGARWVLLPIFSLMVIAYFAPFAHWGLIKELQSASDVFRTELIQHLLLVLSALPLIIVLGIALGFIASQKAWLEDIILSVNGFIQTIPSIALYGLLLPLLAFYGQGFTVLSSLVVLAALIISFVVLFYALHLKKIPKQLKSLAWTLVVLSIVFLLPIFTNLIYQVFSQGGAWLAQLSWNASWESLGIRGLGTTPALIALVMYGVFPLIVSVHSSLRGIPAELIDAAKGIGLSDWQIFWKVQFPMTLPHFIDGIRLSCLMLISLTTIAVIVNAGGLGVFLMRGTEQSVSDLILLGCIPAILIAISLDAVLRLVQGVVTPEGLKK